MKKQIPILFSTQMVQAKLAGRKTMTRRLNGMDEVNANPTDWKFTYFSILKDGNMYAFFEYKDTQEHIYIRCPYGKPGDVLWVRETWRKYSRVDENGYTHFDDEIFEYAADGPPPIYLVDGDGFHMYNKDGSEKYVPWHPNIFMRKERSRIWLEVTEIRVERLKSISIGDAMDEGVEYWNVDQDALKGGEMIADYNNYMWRDDPAYAEYNFPSFANPIDSFRTLWQSINGADSWKANPWVWVVSFKVLSTTGKPANL